ncbi:MAG: hypothetical protein Q9174_005052 [Haloplaca sp. 1 TL-2023]
MTDNLSCRYDALGRNSVLGESDDLSSAQRWLAMGQQQQQIKNPTVEEGQSFFDFEPPLESKTQYTSQYPPLNDNSMSSGWNALPPQVPSPPDSATSPPSSWPPFQYQQPAVHNILTDIYPDTRVQFGQTTPPDDERHNMFAALKQSARSQVTDPSLTADETKRKRNGSSGDDNNPPHKRSRKNGRSAKSNRQPLSNAEDVRRNKFLERNRIAASKCRQKKKEWTQNLEARARELHKENSSLRLLVDSLREEMLFIKGEMVKHSSCGCEPIQNWLKSSANSIATSPVIKAEHSPINSAPGSRRNSVDFGTDTPAPCPAHFARGDTENLEHLLVTQLVHDTSDKAIASSLQAA